MFQNDMEKLRQVRQDFDRAVGDHLPNARELGERCTLMAVELIEAVNESPNMPGANVPETDLQRQKATEGTVEHAQDARKLALRVLEEVDAALRKLK